MTASLPDYQRKNPQAQIVQTEKEILFQEGSKTTVTITFHCLPDGIDPRPR